MGGQNVHKYPFEASDVFTKKKVGSKRCQKT